METAQYVKAARYIKDCKILPFSANGSIALPGVLSDL